MITILSALLSLLSFRLRSRASLEFEVVALRHQVAVLRRQRSGRLRLFCADRLLWVWLYRIWPRTLQAMVLVKPATVVQWQRKGFRLYWRWRSRSRQIGRPKTSTEIRQLIRQMSMANPIWGAPRIHGELLMLGIEVSQATVGRYMPWRSKVPSPTWRSFLHNHMRNMAAVDMFVVATATLGDVDVQYVWRFLREHNIDLTARKSWCESNDPAFAAKAADVVGLYVDPPAKAIVLCVDEKPSIQALERAQGYLKLPNGRALTGQSHDYKRHGTTTLFAALDVATGRIIAAHSKRRRRVEFLGFMNSVVTAFPDRELHVILGSCQGSDYGDDRHEDRKFHVSARSLLKPSADPKESPELAPEICTGR